MGFRNGAPSLRTVTSDNKKLVGVILMLLLGAGRRSVRIWDMGECCSERTIFLILLMNLFRCRQTRESSVGRRRTRMRRRRWGRSRGRGWARSRRGDVVRWEACPKGLCRRAFRRASVRGVKRVRAVSKWERQQ